MNHESAKLFYDAIRPAIEKIVLKEMSNSVRSSPATVKSADNTFRKATVLLAGSKDTPDQYITLDNYTGIILSPGDTVWIQYWGSLTNAVITHKSLTGNEEYFGGGDVEVAASIQVGTTTTGPAGSNASVTNSGTSTEAVLNFVIPQGAEGPIGKTGATPVITIGEVEELGNGDLPYVKIRAGSTLEHITLDFGLPKGDTGDIGKTPTISIGSVINLPAGDTPYVSVASGSTAERVTFNFGLPSGQDGKDGKDGLDGNDGINGQDGKNGEDGADGVSCTHEWNGSILTITSASGTSSADLRGPQGCGASIVRW